MMRLDEIERRTREEFPWIPHRRPRRAGRSLSRRIAKDARFVYERRHDTAVGRRR